MSNIEEIFKPSHLYGIELHYDKRVKMGNFVPDKKTGKFYRIHPGMVQRLDIEIAKANAPKDFNALHRAYLDYQMLALNPPIIVGGTSV